MNLRQKNRILSWTLIIILIFNISAIGTLIYKHHQFVRECNNREQFFGKHHPNMTNMNFSPKQRIKRKDIYKNFLIKEINLTPEQQNKFDKIRKNFVSQTYTLFDSIRHYNNKIDSQLDYDKPDTLLINNYSSRIGNLHKRIKIRYIKYNLQIKSILNPKQKKEYFDAFMKFREQWMFMNHRQQMNRCKR